MKTKVFLMAALAAMALVSCKKDNAQNEETTSGEKAFTKIVLTQKSLAGRTTGDPVAPTASEEAVTSATLYVFNNLNVLENKVNLALVGADWTANFETTTGNHKFYALVNTGGLPATEQTKINAFVVNVTNLSVFERTVLDVTSAGNLTTANNFFMTNVTAPAAINLQSGGTLAAPPVSNQLVIQVGRAVAKISLWFNVPAGAQPASGVLSTASYKMKAMPKKMYLQPVYNSGVFNTPLHTTTYAAADYFAAAGYLAACTGAVGVGTASTSEYIMENSNNIGGNALKAKTTYAVIKGTFTPTQVYDAGGLNPVAGTTGVTFWRVGITDDATPTGNVVDYTTKFYSAQPSGAEVTAAGGHVALEYTNGVTFYPFWIADTRYANPVKYDIHRNSYYFVNIVSVSGCGTNDEDNVVPADDEDDPVEQSAFVKGTLEILPWVEIDQTGGI